MIYKARSAGFCFGVSRAVDIAANAAPAFTYGPLIHNRHAVEELAERGVLAVSDLGELPPGATLILRSHGAAPAFYKELEERGISFIDATCPFVERIHKLVSERQNRMILILGDENHPEVVATAAWCKSAYIVQNLAEMKQWFRHYDGVTPVTVVQQSTYSLDECKQCEDFFKKQCTNGEFLDTICGATIERQKEAAALSGRVDAMVVVGDPSSANTNSLAAACRGKVYITEDAASLNRFPWQGHARLGLTAGASTPPSRIKEVFEKMSAEQNKIQEIKHTNTGAANVADTKNDIPGETEDMFFDAESFEAMLDESFKTLHSGDKVTGIVTAVSPTEVSVDLGTKHAAYIPLAELTDDPTQKADELVKVGDEIETYVVRVNDVEGTAVLSKRRMETAKSWEDVENARENGAIVEGIVVEENKGGIVVSVKGVRVFVPASQTGLPRDTPLATMIRTRVKLRVTEFNRARRRVVGSIRSARQEVRKAAAEAIWSSIEVGNTYEGTVRSITNYGVFVDIGGVDGLVHLTELSWERVRNPADFTKVGDKLTVHVIKLDRENQRISLGHRKSSENPWLRFTQTYRVGDTITAKIVKLMAFGAFAQVMPGVDGLIHISQLSAERVNQVADVVSEGDLVDVKITEVDLERKKISLSIRALMEEVSPVDVGDGRPDEIVATSGEGGTLVSEGLELE